MTLAEALRVLKVFRAFHAQHQDNFKEEKTGDWKKTCASSIGWAILLIATFGRIMIFQAVVVKTLGEFWNDGNGNPSPGAVALTYIFAAIVPNVIQGWVEKNAVTECGYDLLRGDKIPNGSTHKPLRIAIKGWDYLNGIFHTLPYLTLAFFLIGNQAGLPPTIYPWGVLLLIFFGLADAFNTVAALHKANLNVVNAVDSAIATYWEPSTEYKRDKLIRMTRQIRSLFKNLDPDVLEEVDQKLREDKADQGKDIDFEGGYI